MSEGKKITLATGWLDGCSGCHMSFLDIDERLLELAEKVEFVFSPLVDAKELPETVDVGILEGAVSTEEDLERGPPVPAALPVPDQPGRLRRLRQRAGDAEFLSAGRRVGPRL